MSIASNRQAACFFAVVCSRGYRFLFSNGGVRNITLKICLCSWRKRSHNLSSFYALSSTTRYTILILEGSAASMVLHYSIFISTNSLTFKFSRQIYVNNLHLDNSWLKFSINLSVRGED